MARAEQVLPVKALYLETAVVNITTADLIPLGVVLAANLNLELV